MRRFDPVFVSMMCLWLGCSNPATSATEPDATPQPDVVEAPDDVEASEDVEAPDEDVFTRNEGCGPYDDGAYGPKVPWAGFEHEGTTYTCNTCRGGLEEFQGAWRVLDFATEDPDVALTDDWAQTFTFDGNTWRQVATWRQGDGWAEATIEGWYWCSTKPEIHNETKVFVFTDLSPADAFGYEAGAVLTADLLVSLEGGDKLAFMFYDGFNTGDQLAEVYCRVGSDVTTLAGETKPCTDPFE
jgi:hypothetical protein